MRAPETRISGSDASSVSQSRRPRSCSSRTRFSSRVYSRTRCWYRLSQLASTTARTCRGRACGGERGTCRSRSRAGRWPGGPLLRAPGEARGIRGGMRPTGGFSQEVGHDPESRGRPYDCTLRGRDDRGGAAVPADAADPRSGEAREVGCRGKARDRRTLDWRRSAGDARDVEPQECEVASEMEMTVEVVS